MVDEVVADPKEKDSLEEETEFEASFNEHAAKKEPVIEEEPDPEDEEEVEVEVEALPSNDGKSEEELAAEAEAKAAEEKEDPYAGLSPEAKARVIALEEQNKELTHRINSDAGRVSAFQRKVNDLEGEIQSIRTGSTSGNDQPSNAQIADAMKGSDEQWEQFRQDYPEVAGAIDSRLEKAGKATQETIESTLAPVKERQARDQQSEVEAAAKAAVDAVAEVYPTWTEAVQTEDFKTWLDKQPPGVVALSFSDEPADASALIGLYDGHLVAEGQPSLKASDPGPGVEKTEKQKEAEKLAAKRAQQLADGTTVKSKPSQIGPGDGESDEFETAFAAFAKRKEAKRQSA